MESKAFNIDVNVTVESQNPLFGLLNTVVINQTRYFEEFTFKDGGVRSLGFFPASSFPQIFLKLETFKPGYVFQTLFGQLNDDVLSQKISDKIVVEAQRGTSQGFKQPLFLHVFVKLTPKPMPSYSPPVTKKSELEKTCPICWENMSEGSDDYFQLSNCSHSFHKSCVMEWVDRDKNSCPLCRQPVYEDSKSKSKESESEGEEYSESESQESESEGEEFSESESQESESEGEA